jgi:hypothetical protein
MRTDEDRNMEERAADSRSQGNLRRVLMRELGRWNAEFKAPPLARSLIRAQIWNS